jgi:hypothetical protein
MATFGVPSSRRGVGVALAEPATEHENINDRKDSKWGRG